MGVEWWCGNSYVADRARYIKKVYDVLWKGRKSCKQDKRSAADATRKTHAREIYVQGRRFPGHRGAEITIQRLIATLQHAFKLFIWQKKEILQNLLKSLYI